MLVLHYPTFFRITNQLISICLVDLTQSVMPFLLPAFIGWMCLVYPDTFIADVFVASVRTCMNTLPAEVIPEHNTMQYICRSLFYCTEVLSTIWLQSLPAIALSPYKISGFINVDSLVRKLHQKRRKAGLALLSVCVSHFFWPLLGICMCIALLEIVFQRLLFSVLHPHTRHFIQYQSCPFPIQERTVGWAKGTSELAG